MAAENTKLGPFPKPVPWHVIEYGSGGTTVYCVDAKTYWEARANARVLNPMLNTDGCTFLANVTIKTRKKTCPKR